ncbi:(deoxy)nucleoside triphosphate pyrophosphohydrolase [Bdellovibrio sp. SKB1291214]|uniref:(deoxy)nucleoside triphosphate pyrophosphohydrolase n=1 Tax=Bdellovibrio sp. SKB1291214 TaxID=1732569 RepID=UPI000B514FE0|nr:(deoxy)nucleoside triphosphate pyrophosphohydrolase [Bdellovibrio sp. SKB1291214]UYL08338.1 (deoxy)nucleoside triphosphate pyrophosphohydrolase [Bdellovibrio sp. SKB1291214]
MSDLKKPVLVVAAVIRRENDSEKRILLVRRGPDQSGAGFWEFPGGKVEPSESPEQALRREIDEELGIRIIVGALIDEQDFAYPTKTIRLRVYESITSDVHITLTEHDAMKWLKPEEIVKEELSAADRPFVDLLQGKR